MRSVDGNAMIAWDFPFGYPSACGLGGGRSIARRLAGLVEDGPQDSNNRFDVADALNRDLGSDAGPFWARPRTRPVATVPEKKPDFSQFPFPEWRIAERHARAAGFPGIQSVWKLYTTGSVGSQALMGLAAIHRLNERLEPASPAFWWPFETAWASRLSGLVHVECWPSLFDLSGSPYPIRDQAQVAVTRDRILQWQAEGTLRQYLSAPEALTAAERDAVMTDEGWILGLSAH